MDVQEALQALAGLARADKAFAVVAAVGGAVRDVLLGRPVRDIDLAVPGDLDAFAVRAARATRSRPVEIAQTGLVRLPLDDGYLDLVSFRDTTLARDLEARDFTINAMAVRLRDLPGGGLHAVAAADIVDPFDGRADLRAGLLRFASPRALEDDPLRALRAVRLACELAMQLEPATAARLGQARDGLAGVAPERVGAELERLFRTPRAAHGARLLAASGLLTFCFPALAEGAGVEQRPVHRHDVLEHQLVAAEWMDVLLSSEEPAVEPARAIWRGAWLDAEWPESRWGDIHTHLAHHAPTLRLATLLHDAGKPRTVTLEADGRTRFFGHSEVGAELSGAMLRRWRFPSGVVRRVELLVRQHLRAGQATSPGAPPTPRAIHRFHRALGDATPDVCFLFLADSLGTAGPEVLLPRWPAYVAHVRRIITWRPPATPDGATRLLDGHGVMAATGLAPGAEVGRILEAVDEAAAAGEVRGRAEAEALARRLASMPDNEPGAGE
ncbi:MAG: HD domain-containing protein [Dehalococcoidia bacterium]|nr:HD domain-containing protein [Dehalococcoidia bacterium]